MKSIILILLLLLSGCIFDTEIKGDIHGNWEHDYFVVDVIEFEKLSILSTGEHSGELKIGKSAIDWVLVSDKWYLYHYSGEKDDILTIWVKPYKEYIQFKRVQNEEN